MSSGKGSRRGHRDLEWDWGEVLWSSLAALICAWHLPFIEEDRHLFSTKLLCDIVSIPPFIDLTRRFVSQCWLHGQFRQRTTLKQIATAYVNTAAGSELQILLRETGGSALGITISGILRFFVLVLRSFWNFKN